jgi:hypothetical protein
MPLQQFHLHQYDYAALILAAWLVLRSGPPLWHRLWLLAGVAPMQAISLGNPLPQLIWDFGWLLVLGLGAFGSDRVSAEARSAATTPVKADRASVTMDAGGRSGLAAGQDYGMHMEGR